jgi:hypothetical protein
MGTPMDLQILGPGNDWSNNIFQSTIRDQSMEL